MNSRTQTHLAADEKLQGRLTVTANTVEQTDCGIAVRLQIQEWEHNGIELSIEEARQLSLDIIAAVNKHEQHVQLQRNRQRATVNLYPRSR
jgi:hypothetical protein